MSALLQVSNLAIPSRRGEELGDGAAIHGASFELDKGQGLAIVGESGCGRRTLALALLRHVEPSSGEIHYAEHTLASFKGAGLRELRRKIQIVGPDPLGALSPRYTVAESLAEPLRAHRLCAPREVSGIVETVIQRIGLDASFARRLPSALTAEQALRITIARALTLDPEVLILDEPEAALDMSTTAQAFQLVAELQHAMGFALIFLSGNPSMARYLCGHLAVMYLGRIVEMGPTEDIIAEPRHPYTRALLAAMPRITHPLMPPVVSLTGDPPSGRPLPAGCAFHPRCAQAMEACRSGAAPIRRSDGDVAVWCHLYPESPNLRR
jgi:peptide/nickel transport system ATP-binding protein